MPIIKNVLMSFIGSQDPYSKDKTRKGPILNFLDNRPDFGRVIIFYNEQFWKFHPPDYPARKLPPVDLFAPTSKRRSTPPAQHR